MTNKEIKSVIIEQFNKMIQLEKNEIIKDKLKIVLNEYKLKKDNVFEYSNWRMSVQDYIDINCLFIWKMLLQENDNFEKEISMLINKLANNVFLNVSKNENKFSVGKIDKYTRYVCLVQFFSKDFYEYKILKNECLMLIGIKNHYDLKDDFEKVNNALFQVEKYYQKEINRIWEQFNK